MEKIEDIIESTLFTAKSLGAEEAELILTNSNSFSLKAEDKEVSEYKVASSTTIGIRTQKNNKIGISYSESLNQDDLKKMILQALGNSKLSDTKEFEKILSNNSKKIDGTNDTVFQKDSTETQRKIDLVLKMESGVKEKGEHVKSSPYNGYSETESHYHIANTKGVFCEERSRSFSCYTSALIEKDNKNSIHYHQSLGRTFLELSPLECINQSYQHANDLLLGKPLKTGKYDVIFSTDSLSELFSSFSNIFSGKAAMDGLNPFKDKIGDKIGNSNLTIRDCPQMKNGFNYSFFDSEGNPTSETVLIENGKFKTFYHNSATSHFFKVDNNNHASRGARSSLSTGGFNKVISIGNEKNIRSGNFFEIISLQGIHSGSNDVSGEFSFGASGYLYENGKLIAPVRGVTVSGNFFNKIKELEVFGDKLIPDSSKTFFAPEIIFPNMTIAGE